MKRRLRIGCAVFIVGAMLTVLGALLKYHVPLILSAAETRAKAEQGDAEAQFRIAHFYRYGYGVFKNSDRAIQWDLKAAAQGHALAQLTLGTCCFYADGLPKDLVEAYKWFDLAASRDHQLPALSQANAAAWRKNAARWRDSIALTMTPAQIAEAQRRSKGWQPTPPP